jgi:hypothetical protein
MGERLTFNLALGDGLGVQVNIDMSSHQKSRCRFLLLQPVWCDRPRQRNASRD